MPNTETRAGEYAPDPPVRSPTGPADGGQLQDALGRLRLLAAHTKGIIFELDGSARIVRVWTSDPDLLARPEPELLGRTVVEVLGPQLGQRHHDAALRTVREGCSAKYDYELEVPGGKRHFSCESTAVPSPNRRGRHAVFWIRDTTEQVELREKLLNAERQASLGVLAAGVAHEINNPLGYVLLNAESLRRALGEASISASKPLLSHADMIYEGAHRMQRIVQELLQLSRPDTALEPVGVEAALHEACSEIEGHKPSDLRISLQVGPACIVQAHRGRLVQVFSNLLSNAVEALDDHRRTAGEAPIRVEARHAGAQVEIAFRDLGVGFESTALPKIFDPFFTTKQDGTGLGLAICHRIISSFNGSIHAEPNRPHGAVFHITLRAAG